MATRGRKTNEPVQAWQQQEGESAVAYSAFCAYRDLGSERSLEKVVQTYGKSIALHEKWSRRWQWVNRATTYDMHMQSIVQAERERLEREQGHEWAKRQIEHRERAYGVAQRLLDKAEKMLNFPLQTVTTTTDGHTTIVHPARWGMSDVARLVETADKVTRLAAELPTEIIKLFPELEQELDKQGIDITEFMQQTLAKVRAANANTNR